MEIEMARENRVSRQEHTRKLLYLICVQMYVHSTFGAMFLFRQYQRKMSWVRSCGKTKKRTSPIETVGSKSAIFFSKEGLFVGRNSMWHVCIIFAVIKERIVDVEFLVHANHCQPIVFCQQYTNITSFCLSGCINICFVWKLELNTEVEGNPAKHYKLAPEKDAFLDFNYICHFKGEFRNVTN